MPNDNPWKVAVREIRNYRRWRCRTWLFLAAVIIAGLVALFEPGTWWPTDYAHQGSTDNPDATVLVSTLIVIYTFFIVAYGPLTPAVVKMPSSWGRTAILTLIALAVVLDLFRVLNSSADLYRTTVGQFNFGQIHDAEAEFARYFIANAVVIGIAWSAATLQVASERSASRD